MNSERYQQIQKKMSENLCAEFREKVGHAVRQCLPIPPINIHQLSCHGNKGSHGLATQLDDDTNDWIIFLNQKKILVK